MVNQSKMGDSICLFTTYFISPESGLERCHKQYLKRVDQARSITEVLFVSDWIRVEDNDLTFELLMIDLRRDMQALGQYPFNEDEWGLYSLSCVAKDVGELASEGANVSRLWNDLRLGEERVPRIFTSCVSAIDLSKDGRGGKIGEFYFQ